MTETSQGNETAGARFRSLVLDFDGVVLESVDIKTDAFRELFSGYPGQVDAIVAYHLAHNGISRFLKFEHIYRHFLSLPYEEREKADISERFSAIVFRRLLECPFVPGALELLERCASRVPVYVASASPEEELNRIVEARGLSRYFVEAFGHPTRKSDVIRLVLQRHGLRPEEVLYVGDSQEDFRAASAEGVFFVGRRNREPLDTLGVPVFSDLTGVAAWLAHEGGLEGA